MNIRKDYPYNDALDDLERFFKTHIKDPKTLTNFLECLSKCRINQTVSFRYIHEELMAYRKSFSDYFDYSETEDQMIDDLFYFWS